MAFTRILGPGIHTASNINSHNIKSTGIITAVSFVGDGSGLTGVASTDNIVTGTAATFNTYPVDINAGMTVAGVSTMAAITATTGTFSGTIETTGSHLKITGAEPRLTFTDTDNNPDFQIWANAQKFSIYDSTNSATRINIDSVGHVCINTTTEGHPNADDFTISFNNQGVSGGDQGRCGMTIRSGDNTSGVTQNGYIYFSDGTSGANESKGVVAYEHSNDAMYFSTDQVARLRIDSSGRVTKPYTPAFLAYHHSYDVNYGPNATLPYMHTVYNTGNHYNTSNSTFTAPIAGRYLFSANANGNFSSSYGGIPRAYWKINGSNVGNAIHLRGSDATHDGLEQRSQTVIFNLAANDTVKIVVGQNQWDLFGANSFTGYLIG